VALSSVPALDSASSPLQFFVGRWSCAGGTPSGRVLIADVVFTPRMQGHWLESHHVDRPPGRYESLGMWSLAEPPSRESATVVYDNFDGARRFNTSGFLDGVVVWTRDTSETDARLETFTYRRMSDSSYWYAWHVRRSPDTPLVLGDSATCRRA